MSHPKPRTYPWWLRPIVSRQQFSPRLFLAWQSFYVAAFIAIWWVTRSPRVEHGVLIQPSNVEGIVGLFLALTGAALSLGTYQTVKLGDAPVNTPPPNAQSEEAGAEEAN